MSTRTVVWMLGTLFLTLRVSPAVAGPSPPAQASITPTDHQMSSALMTIIADYPGNTNVCVFASPDVLKGSDPSLQPITDFVTKHGEQMLLGMQMSFRALKNSLRSATRINAAGTLHFTGSPRYERCRASLIIERMYSSNDTALMR